jgi:glycosyltransferase involved in cell wall biosynthesis
MRICYLINGLNGGGAAFPMVEIIGLMRRCGHDVKVLALMRQDGRAAARLEQAGIPFEIIGGGPRDYLASSIALLRHLRLDRPDVLWTSLSRATMYGQVAGWLLGIPVISWQHSDYLKPGNRRILSRSRRLTRRWIADSETVKQFTMNTLGVAATDIDIWPMFSARADAPQAAAWNGEGLFRVGSLGRLHTSKQYAVLIRAAARLQALDPQRAARMEFVIAGAGDEEAELRALADQLGVKNFRLVGFVEQPSKFLAGLHVYIQTSLKEGLCVAAHEAMQAGLPVISTRVGEIAVSVLHQQTGWLCEVGDVEALALALLAAVKDPAQTARMGQAGRARVLARFGAEQAEAAGRDILRRLQDELQG